MYPILRTRLGSMTDGPYTAGTVVGTPALTASTVAFDLGPYWDCYTHVQIMIGTPAGPTGIQELRVSGSDSATMDWTRVLVSTGQSGMSPAGGQLTAPFGTAMIVRPAGRFIVLWWMNRDTTAPVPNGATVEFAAYTS